VELPFCEALIRLLHAEAIASEIIAELIYCDLYTHEYINMGTTAWVLERLEND
jgi:hypothetical protein